MVCRFLIDTRTAIHVYDRALRRRLFGFSDPRFVLVEYTDPSWVWNGPQVVSVVPQCWSDLVQFVVVGNDSFPLAKGFYFVL